MGIPLTASGATVNAAKTSAPTTTAGLWNAATVHRADHAADHAASAMNPALSEGSGRKADTTATTPAATQPKPSRVMVSQSGVHDMADASVGAGGARM